MRSTNTPYSQASVIVLMIVGFTLVACQTSKQTSSNVPRAAETDSKTVGQRPFLKVLIENVSMYPVPNRREDLAVSLVVSMSNSGQASIAKGWKLEVNSTDPSIPSDLDPVHVDGVVDMPGPVVRKVDLGREDLALKAAENPIANNAQMNGVLTFVLPKTSESELADNNTSFVLRVLDYQGNTYRTPKAVIHEKRSGVTSRSTRKQ